MQSKKLKWLILALAAIVGLVLGYDALVVTDEEVIESLSETISGSLTPDKVQANYHWIQPDRVPITVEALGNNETYRTESEFRQAASRGLARVYGQDLRVLSDSIRVEGNRATLEMRIMTDQGMGRFTFELEKSQEDWLIRKFRLSR